MLKYAATACLALAVALSPISAAPAKALDRDETIGLIVGLAALAAIAKEIDDRNDRKKKRKEQQRVTRHAPIEPRYDRYRHQRSLVLPGNCVRTFDTVRGTRTVLGNRCLQRSGVNVARLPDRCERTVQTRNGPRAAFGARCLRREGYQIGAW